MRLAGSGLGIREVVGLSVNVMVEAGRAAGGVVALAAGFLTTMFRFRVSFWLSKISSAPKSSPSKKSSSSSTGLGFGEGSAWLSRGGDGVAKAGGGDETSSMVKGTDVGADVGASVGELSRRRRGGRGEASCSLFLSLSRRAAKSSPSLGKIRPDSPSSSLSTVMQLPKLGLMADTTETDELLAPREVACRVPAKRMPRLPSPKSSKSKSSWSPAGVRGDGAFSFNPSFAFCGSSKSFPQSSSSSILRLDFFFPSRFIVPPRSALGAIDAGIGMPACWAADVMALAVEGSSFGVIKTCQLSSSPVFDSERTDMREDRDKAVDVLNSRPSFSSNSSSHDSISGLLLVRLAIRAAKLRLGAAMLARARGVVVCEELVQIVAWRWEVAGSRQ